MLNRFKSAFNNVINTLESTPNHSLSNGSGDIRNSRGQSEKGSDQSSAQLKFRYSRPDFLLLQSDEEIQVSADHIMRPIIVPRDITKLPFNSGYAETINAGKSVRNEDHASVYRGTLRAIISDENISNKVSDMMPTVPGYPHQIPVGNKKVSVAKPLLKSESTENNEKTGGTTDVNDSDVKTTDNGVEDNQKVPEMTTTDNSVNELKPNELSLEPSTVVPNLDDLISPSTPVPLEVRLAEAAADIVESAYVTPESSPEKIKTQFKEESLPWLYFAVFDGHAGSGVAVAVSNTLHKIIESKLQTIADLLIKFGLKDNLRTDFDLNNLNESHSNSKCLNGSVVINQDNHLDRENIALLFHPSTDKMITVDNLITGALESAFWEMDTLIERDKHIYRMSGGCTACVAVFILGKLYLANAGDSRAIICKDSQVIPMSFDFTPESERERIKYLGLLKPELLGNDFTHLEFVRRPARRDLGKKLLYRDAFMTGWSYKTITIEDLKFPLIYGEGKRSRVLATIGVTRGFGDHELRAQNSDVPIKPFLTAQPEVRIYDIENDDNVTDGDVLVIGTDGLWDITTNEMAADVILKSLDVFPANDTQRYKYRYISAAQDLVMHSRGKSRERGRGWKTADNKTATIDDISVFVIPLKPYKEEYINWKSGRNLVSAHINCDDR